MMQWGLSVVDCAWDYILLYSYQWICRAWNKEMLARTWFMEISFGTNFLVTNILIIILQNHQHHCYYFHCYHYYCHYYINLNYYYHYDYISIIIFSLTFRIVITSNIIIFIALLLLLLHHYFILFSSHYL